MVESPKYMVGTQIHGGEPKYMVGNPNRWWAPKYMVVSDRTLPVSGLWTPGAGD